MKLSIASDTGFTLIETVMVIVLLGVILITAIPKFFQRSVFDERVLFDDTLNAIRYAQKLAVVTGCKIQVAVSGDAYTLTRPSSRAQCDLLSPSFTLDVVHPGTGEPAYTGSQANVTLSASPPTFTFDALGRASADVTITVAGKTIDVVADTGLVYAP